MLTTLAFALAVGSPAHPPKWFSLKLAGHRLESGEKDTEGIYDRATGFYLFRTGECDGAYIGLVLTRDRNEVTQAGYYVPNFTPKEHGNGKERLRHRHLASLSTGGGVRIGDSMEAVRRRLGRPTSLDQDDSKARYPIYVYEWREKGPDARVYEQRYTFKEGKLIEIQLSRGMD
jgi:hypothetical protein